MRGNWINRQALTIWAWLESGNFVVARRRHFYAAAVALVSSALLGGCGAHLPANQPVISISPVFAQLQADLGQQHFAAFIQNDSNTQVVWKVNGILGGNAAYGHIDGSGNYSAPAVAPDPAQIQVTAVSVADSQHTASATVQITPAVQVSISPANPFVKVRTQQQFTATVDNAVNTAVSWAVNGVAGGLPATGTIDANGLYTAPATYPGVAQVTVTAVSQQDPNQSGSTAVNLNNGVIVTVTPAVAAVDLGGSLTFTANVQNTDNTAVSWSVNDIEGGNPQIGTISAQGVYTAPRGLPASNAVTITATSVADPTASGSAQLTLNVPPGAFSLSPAQVQLSMAKATSQSVTFTVTTASGFDGTIQFALSGAPPNVTAAFTPQTLTGSGTVILKLSTTSISLAGSNLPLLITATSQTTGGGSTLQTANLVLTIQGWAGQVHTVAGGPGGPGFQDGSGPSDELEANALANDGAGNIYFLDGQGYALRGFNIPSGAVNTLQGSPYTFSFADGEGLALDRRSNTFYIADSRDNRILRYTAGDQKMTVLAGGGAAGSKDGQAQNAQFNRPMGVALSPDGTTLYVADSQNDLIRSVNVASGMVTTIAGQAGIAGHLDGTHPTLCAPRGVSLNDAGTTLYFGDTCSYDIRALNLSSGAVTTLAGTGQPGAQDGPALQASFSDLRGLAVDPHNGGAALLYVADSNEVRVLTLGPAPLVYTLAGQAKQGTADGGGSSAMFDSPRDLTVEIDQRGTNTSSIFVADTKNGLLRRIDFANPLQATSAGSANVLVTTIAGQVPDRGRADGLGTGTGFNSPSVAQFNAPWGIATDGTKAYVADSGNSAIRAVDLSTTIVSTIAGPGFGNSDGPALGATFNGPTGLALNAANGWLFISDTGNNEVRKLDLNAQLVTTIAGGTTAGYTDGSLSAARFDQPMGIAASPDGSRIYVADTGNNAIRIIDLNADTVSTLAGGHPGTADGVGTLAEFNGPEGVALDPTGAALYISDSGNHTIRRLDLSTRAVTTIAGTAGDCGFADGFGANALICDPGMIATDGNSIFWGDQAGGLVRALNLSTGAVTTLAGQPALIHMADGDYTEVPGTLTGPVRYNVTGAVAVAPDASFLLFSDRTANTVRIVQ